jgi:uncharacterized membrane protein
MSNQPKNILQRYPIVPVIGFMLFAWSLLHLITAYKAPLAKPTIPKSNSSKVLLSPTKDEKVLFECIGTEPFWSAKITDKRIYFEDFGTETRESCTYIIKIPHNRSEASGQIFEGKLSAGIIRVIILPKEKQCPCSDGMSETDYLYEVLIEQNGAYTQGCAK